MTLEYATPPARRKIPIKPIIDWSMLGVAAIWFVSSALVLATPGGFVDHYLWTIAVALYPLGWARSHIIKAFSAVIILVCLWMANEDHHRGMIYRSAPLRAQMNAMTTQIQQLKAATQAASSASQPSN
jgi:hypothetical protein